MSDRLHDKTSQAAELSRRMVLRGLGVSLALPWLESVPVWGGTPQGQAAGDAPTRFGCVFAGNGFASKHWWAKGSGADMELGKVLEPLAPLREKLVFVRGLYNANAQGCGIHSCQTGNVLSGSKLQANGEIRAGISVDQLLARRIGNETKVPSLVIGCEKPYVGVHKGYTMLYSSHISWSSPTTPAPQEIYPALAFDRLFGDDRVQRGDKSVLDAVLEDATGLRQEISRLDRRKLDEYLTSVREVEKRIHSAGQQRRLEGWRPTLEEPNMPRPADGWPQDIHEHMRLMCDLLVLAFQTDTTRVCTLKLNNDHSGLRFPNLGIDHIIHHLLSHQDGNPDWLKVNQYFLQHLAYILDRMDQVQEGERTLLDNSLILFCSSMLTGNHKNDELPVLLCGRAGGRLKTGRTLDFLKSENRKMCSMYLSLMDKMGVPQHKFGDSSEPLAEI